MFIIKINIFTYCEKLSNFQLKLYKPASGVSLSVNGHLVRESFVAQVFHVSDDASPLQNGGTAPTQNLGQLRLERKYIHSKISMLIN